MISQTTSNFLPDTALSASRRSKDRYRVVLLLCLSLCHISPSSRPIFPLRLLPSFFFPLPHGALPHVCVRKVVQAMGLSFHPEHFQCIKCECSLAGVSFYAEKNMPYCSPCYAELHSPKCARCTQHIVGVSRACMHA